jgi:hypothetical protein
MMHDEVFLDAISENLLDTEFDDDVAGLAYLSSSVTLDLRKAATPP